MKDVIGKRKADKITSSFKFGNITITNNESIAGGFNEYFVNVRCTLSYKIPYQNICSDHYLRGNYMASFYLDPVDETEIISLVNSLKHSAPGLDDVRTDIIKHVKHLRAEPLTHIFENCMYSRLIGYINEHKIFYKHQFSFREQHSTQHRHLYVCVTSYTCH